MITYPVFVLLSKSIKTPKRKAKVWTGRLSGPNSIHNYNYYSMYNRDYVDCIKYLLIQKIKILTDKQSK